MLRRRCSSSTGCQRRGFRVEELHSDALKVVMGLVAVGEAEKVGLGLVMEGRVPTVDDGS